MVNPKLKTKKTDAQRETRYVPREFTITIQKTLQEPKFNPSVVTITEVHEVSEGDDYDKMVRVVRRQLSDKVEQAIEAEVARYQGRGEDE